VAYIRIEERYIKGLVGRPEGRRPFGRRWLRWEDNIKNDLHEVSWGSMDWITLA
jgi:hypothetical protein